MKKKTVFISLGVVLLLLVVIGGFFILKDLRQETKLENEMNEIYDMTDQEKIDEEALKKRLSTYVSTGDYLKVEKALKQYVLDVYETSKKVQKVFTDERLGTLLSVDNYKKDGKEFKETKAYIKQFITDAEDCKKRFVGYLDNDTIMTYIKDEKLDSYYVDFYKELAFDEADDYKKEQEELTKSIDEAVSAVKQAEKVIDFLIKNKSEWYIEKDSIYFNSQKLVDEYNKLIEI